MPLLRLLLVIALLLPAPAFAGFVQLKNGDRVTGQITRIEAGRLYLNSPAFGAMSVPLDKVETFSTDKPVRLRLKGGESFRQIVQPGQDGTIRLVPPATRPAVDSPEAPLPGENPDVPDDPPTSPEPLAPLPPDVQQVRVDRIARLVPTRQPQKLSGNVRLGVDAARGNTDTDNVNAAAELVRRSVDDRTTLTGSYYFGRSRDPDSGTTSTTADALRLAAKQDYFLTDALYLFARADFERDSVAELLARTSPTAGVGYQFLEREAENLSAEAGLGVTYEHFQDEDADLFPTARLAYGYDRKLAQRLKLLHSAEFLPALDSPLRYRLNADAGLRLELSARWFLDYKLEYRRNTQPAEGTLKDDLRNTLSLGWSF